MKKVLQNSFCIICLVAIVSCSKEVKTPNAQNKSNAVTKTNAPTTTTTTTTTQTQSEDTHGHCGGGNSGSGYGG